MAYYSEQALVDQFTECLTSSASPWGEVDFTVEFDYMRGKTDVVAVADDGFVIAFEAKLTKWRDALQQAYRNTCFAHRSYIVVPEEIAKRALLHSVDFTHRKVGLCYISDGVIIIIHDAILSDPIQPWLSLQASVATSGVQQHASTTDGKSGSSNLCQQRI